MKQLLSFLAGCLLATSTLAAGLITPHAGALKECQQEQPRTKQPLPGKNTLTRDEQAKLAAHLDMMAEQAVQLVPTKADNAASGNRLDKPRRYTASQSRRADELS
ncbi:hypothetical protein [Pseudogulbenkiania sp. MAI-1]|uniref:hypothetical protein n=1 Tax=Pseudogulbenkiania sp. MAI-1 TaxID=990370 RepID=UPI00045E8C08|nr:hypothetical protein [Pseudogulbenkiania sp. MAI-1]